MMGALVAIAGVGWLVYRLSNRRSSTGATRNERAPA
jgi:hypothetical protein